IYKTTSTVIETDDCVLLVDPTWLPSDIESIQGFVYKIKQNRPLYLLFTHSDYDHILGYGAFPDAITIGSEKLADIAKTPEKTKHILGEIEAFDHQYYLDRPYKLMFPKLDHIVCADGETLEIGGTTLIFYLAKGHTEDGLMTVVEQTGTLIAGDYFSDVEFPFIYDSSYHYEETMNKLSLILKLHSISLLIPGHGTPTDSQEDMIMRQQQALHYIKELRNRLKKDEPTENTLELIQPYGYLRSLISCHEENITLMKKELGL
ncbi:MAG: MBL fold metallo-hydrolase, partial [Bacillus sp. (in: firmicutes)]